jgi:SHS family lactate transporter-like MFS transporter
MRPIGALLFGILADRFGRRPILMFDIVLYSVVELLSAFSPNLTTLIVLRGIFGVAMGGEWGVGSSLVMESIPPQTRGAISGLLQEGYAVGSLLAGATCFLVFSFAPETAYESSTSRGTYYEYLEAQGLEA